MSSLGIHHLIELYECDPRILNDREKVRESLLGAARRARATIVADVFHAFSPHGITGVVVIAESHIAVHTWPEHRFAAVDIFSCSDRLSAETIQELLRTSFQAQRVSCRTLARGDGLRFPHRLPAPPLRLVPNEV